MKVRYSADERSSYVDVLGIDVSKADFHACLIQGSERGSKAFPNNAAGYRQLARWLKNRKCSDVHACMEATGAYWLALANALYAGGLTVSVVNPSRTVLFARSQLRRTKTDAVDAQMIAEFCQTQRPASWSPPAPETLELRALLTYRKELIAQRTALQQIMSQVHSGKALRRLHDKQLKSLESSIAEVDKQLKSHVSAHARLRDEVEKLTPIAGLGFLSATAIVAQLPVASLRNAKAAAAYIGVTPRDRQSGTSVNGKPRICKTGNSELRRDLYMPAMVAMRHNAILRAFAERLAAKGKPAKVIIVAVMRKLIVLAYTVLTQAADTTPALTSLRA